MSGQDNHQHQPETSNNYNNLDATYKFLESLAPNLCRPNNEEQYRDLTKLERQLTTKEAKIRKINERLERQILNLRKAELERKELKKKGTEIQNDLR